MSFDYYATGTAGKIAVIVPVLAPEQARRPTSSGAFDIVPGLRPCCRGADLVWLHSAMTDNTTESLRFPSYWPQPPSDL